MISTLERLLRLLDDHDTKAIHNETVDESALDELFHEREVVERQLLLAPIASDTDAVAKTRFLARILGDGERSDGLDIEALHGVIEWMERRFAATDHGFRRAVA